MTLRKRIEKLERAAPQKQEKLVVIRRVVSRQPGGDLLDAPYSALIVGCPSASSKRLVCQPDEDQDNFRERVLAAANSAHDARWGLSSPDQPH